ncbi:MAG TPA: stomatin-like protein [Turneriella sp.]|nr:stomatin-like protein [Turneriella sp.]HNA78826.1 stomatin-like protein [Turneriella sp.]HNE20872.1 stomatin-like protein [Turneriella sp.]HNJ65806.1 stomatin-like protein [Turneriella sp.]HNN01164.1 stomatin-like protein [Turneriella sp.]
MDNFFTIVILAGFVLVLRMFRVVPMRVLAVKERLGKFKGVLKPGFHFIVPFIDRIAYMHDSREQVIDIPKQRCITRDNVEVDVDGVVYLKVADAQKASYGITNYHAAVISLAQTTMRSEIGKLNLDDTFREREKVNDKIVQEIDKASEPWGIKFIRYEIRTIEPSANMLNTMEKQMEAERQKRADITLAQGEKQARINVSEGEKQAAINVSEGEKLKRINEADGRSAEIRLVADATARGLRRIAEAIGKPGGASAVKMRIVEQFLEEFGKVMAHSKISVVPARIAELQGYFQGLSTLNQATGPSQPQQPQQGRNK